MHPLIRKTFGALTAQYLVRQYFFSAIFATIFFGLLLQAPKVPASAIVWLSICALLYPYSRFVYEGIVGFILGDNVFFGNAIMMMGAKFFTMGMCWTMAPLIAPFGLAYLYFQQSKAGS